MSEFVIADLSASLESWHWNTGRKY